MKRTYLLLLLLFMYWMYASAQQVQTAQEPADSVKNVAYIDSLYRELPEVMITGERPVVKARKLTLYSRFMPLFKAAAMMLLLFTLGGVVKHATDEGSSSGIVYVHDQFENRQANPQVAYEGDSVKTLIRETSSKPRLEENSNR